MPKKVTLGTLSAKTRRDLAEVQRTAQSTEKFSRAVADRQWIVKELLRQADRFIERPTWMSSTGSR